MTEDGQTPLLLRREADGQTPPPPRDSDTPPPGSKSSEQIASDFIAARAYYRWVQKGQPRGTEVQDWLEAEAELRQIKDLTQRLTDTDAILQQSLTESRRGKDLLREAEERYRSIFDNAIEGIFQTTPDGRFLAANPALAHLLGFESPDDLVAGVSDIGQQLHVSPERRREFERLLEDHGRVQGFECQVYRKDGSIIWIVLTARAVRDDAGAVRYFEGMVEDISERKRAEQGLKESEALYHSLVEALPICICRKDLNGRFTFGNRAFCEWLQRPLQQIVGKSDVDFYPGDLAHKYMRDDRRVIENGEVLEAIEEHQKADRVRNYVQVLKAPLFDAGGAVVGMQGIFWDITPRKQAEAELSRTAAEFQVARTIQQKLFPAGSPRVAGLDIGGASFAFDVGGASYPAEAIGGDYYDFFPLPDGGEGIAIGDVSGHGVGPALLMAEARALLRAFAQTQADVSTILGLVNRVLVPDMEGDRFITLLLARLDPRTRGMVYASAGHATGFLLDAAGKVKQPLPSTGIPLGLEADAVCPASAEVTLEPGDLVLLFTDGIVEARAPDGTPFGQQRALDLVRHYRHEPAGEIVFQLYHAVRAYSQYLPQYDDITAAVLKVAPVF